MQKPKIETFENVLHIMLYALGSVSAVIFVILAYVKGLP